MGLYIEQVDNLIQGQVQDGLGIPSDIKIRAYLKQLTLYPPSTSIGSFISPFSQSGDPSMSVCIVIVDAQFQHPIEKSSSSVCHFSLNHYIICNYGWVDND
jgi:hypothetical protein